MSEVSLLHAVSRPKLREALKKIEREGWRPIGDVQVMLIFDGLKFVRLEFQQTVTK